MTCSFRGYAALISTLIVCATLSSLAFGAGMSAYLARLSVLEAEYKALSRSHAYSCTQVALFELSADWNYRPREGGDEVLLTPHTSCRITSVIAEGSYVTVRTTGEHGRFYTELEFRLEERRTSRPPFLMLFFREI